jgi:hypothetical protein
MDRRHQCGSGRARARCGACRVVNCSCAVAHPSPVFIHGSHRPASLASEVPSRRHTSAPSLRTNQPTATSEQYFSLRTNQHQPSATSQPNRLIITDRACFLFNYYFSQITCEETYYTDHICSPVRTYVRTCFFICHKLIFVSTFLNV